MSSREGAALPIWKTNHQRESSREQLDACWKRQRLRCFQLLKAVLVTLLIMLIAWVAILAYRYFALAILKVGFEVVLVVAVLFSLLREPEEKSQH